MKRLAVITLAAMALAGAAAAKPSASTSYAGHELAGQAKVDLAHAKAIALKARPGVITDRELEKEAGGSGLRWSFDIRAHGAAYEVGVDAADGKVLENAKEGAHPD
ncbi:MAG: peptidase [Caulobacter sp.]|nr:peptidase [Caulobacter sp.]